MISVNLGLTTNMMVHFWDQKTIQDYLQLEHRNNIAAAEIVAILGETRQRREERKR